MLCFSYMPELVTYFVLRSLDKSDTDREAVAKLITTVKQDELIDSQTFMKVRHWARISGLVT